MTKITTDKIAASIFALATPQGRSAVQIIRISGPQSASILRKIAGGIPPCREACYTALRLSGKNNDEVVDQALVLFFQSPASATGEDMAELHLHGSPMLGRMVLEWLGRQPSMRLADPGEFTRRAFLNGKINLDQAEGIADLIDADTILQHRQAMRQLDGALSIKTENWREAIITLSAQLEALIDFADEDLPDNVTGQVLEGIDDLIRDMELALSSASQGLIQRDGLKVALMGRPNAGKSTLLNALTGDDRAIVSPQAGTTRDLVQVSLDIDGIAVHLIDTAGIRDAGESVGEIEEEGIRRALEAAASAHIVLMLIDVQEDDPLEVLAGLKDALAKAGTAGDAPSPEIFPLLTKADLILNSSSPSTAVLPKWVQISAQSGAESGVKSREGITPLYDLLRVKLAAITPAAEAPILTRQRHVAAVEQAAQALGRGAQIDIKTAPELMAEEFRLAATAMGRITGHVDVEDLLDHIFSSFCIGK
jgi:tRNA modification GTPase